MVSRMRNHQVSFVQEGPATQAWDNDHNTSLGRSHINLRGHLTGQTLLEMNTASWFYVFPVLVTC